VLPPERPHRASVQLLQEFVLPEAGRLSFERLRVDLQGQEDCNPGRAHLPGAQQTALLHVSAAAQHGCAGSSLDTNLNSHRLRVHRPNPHIFNQHIFNDDLLYFLRPSLHTHCWTAGSAQSPQPERMPLPTRVLSAMR